MYKRGHAHRCCPGLGQVGGIKIRRCRTIGSGVRAFGAIKAIISTITRSASRLAIKFVHIDRSVFQQISLPIDNDVCPGNRPRPWRSR